MSEHYDYDVVIIGAGIGGLVCGCYLAKAGLKTLILEKEHQPGGYCTSFSRKDFKFDTSVHYVGGLKKGALSKIFSDLGVFEKLKFFQSDPSDKIILPNYCTYIRAEYRDTAIELCKSSPKEKHNIKQFFDYILETPLPDIYRRVCNMNFGDFLDEFFIEQNIKSVFGVLLSGNMGLSPSRISAFAAISFLKDFIIDPGYYPSGGIQKIPDTLVQIFKEYGGEILLNESIKKIFVRNQKIKVVEGEKGNYKSKVVISNIDASYFFEHLMDRETKEKKKINNLEISESVFVVYLGLSKVLKKTEICNTWYFKTNDLGGFFSNLKSDIQGNIKGALITFPFLKEKNTDSLLPTAQIFSTVPFINKKFWDNNRKIVTQKLIDMATDVVPNLKGHIVTMLDATPYTFYKYTFNKRGASFGWASTSEQTNSFVFPQITSIKNLFLVGHWTTIGSGQGGISTVALSGKKVSDIILKK